MPAAATPLVVVVAAIPPAVPPGPPAALAHVVVAVPPVVPADPILWNSKTIHSSIETTQPERSRSSVTAHYLPSSTRFMQYQTRVKAMSLSTINGMRVHTPKDLGDPVQRLVMTVETRFPTAFASLKKAAVRVVTR